MLIVMVVGVLMVTFESFVVEKSTRTSESPVNHLLYNVVPNLDISQQTTSSSNLEPRNWRLHNFGAALVNKIGRPRDFTKSPYDNVL